MRAAPGVSKLDLVVTCSGVANSLAAFAFTVRQSHRVVHFQSGLLGHTCAHTARGESVRRAVAWLLAQALAPSRVESRFDSLLFGADLAESIGEHQRRGWDVLVNPVSAEHVSEAAALARRTALTALGAPVFHERPRPYRARRHPVPPRQRRAVSAPAPPQRLRPSPLGPDALIITDGGYRPPPGASPTAVYAFLVFDEDRVVHQENGVVCRGPAACSQMAELAAVAAALGWLNRSAVAPGARVELRCDNQWVVTTLNSQHARRINWGQVMLVRRAYHLLQQLRRKGCYVSIRQVPRKHVSPADSLCRHLYRAGATSLRAPRQPLRAFFRSR